jgi:hypothetical protein
MIATLRICMRSWLFGWCGAHLGATLPGYERKTARSARFCHASRNLNERNQGTRGCLHPDPLAGRMQNKVQRETAPRVGARRASGRLRYRREPPRSRPRSGCTIADTQPCLPRGYVVRPICSLPQHTIGWPPQQIIGSPRGHNEAHRQAGHQRRNA